MSKQEELGLVKNKKKFDIREEYYVRINRFRLDYSNQHHYSVWELYKTDNGNKNEFLGPRGSQNGAYHRKIPHTKVD